MQKHLSRNRKSEMTLAHRKWRPLLSSLESDFVSDHTEKEERTFWAHDAEQNPIYTSQADQAPLPDDGSDRVPDRATVLEKLIVRWTKAAVSHAIVRSIDDPDEVVATVVGIDGAWGFGDSDEEALRDLRSVLIDWASMKLKDGDDDIPSMEGLRLVVDR